LTGPQRTPEKHGQLSYGTGERFFIELSCLADVFYVRAAETQAVLDRERIIQHFKEGKRSPWTLTLEHQAQVDAFWNAVQAGNAE
jgi:hypothetical protein